MLNLETKSYAKSYNNELHQIKSYDLSCVSDHALKEMSINLKAKAESSESILSFLPESFVLVFESIKRTLHITPFDVQLLAAISMAKGNIIELPTGEGKTLVAVFAAYLNSLSGNGVHVFTFNDFLAKRDAQWMKPFFHFLGISVDYISETKTKEERKAAYQADVTYVTVKEAGYDYLRSFLAYDVASIVQRPFHYAIIDEADSIMIDNARVPLIVAGDASYAIEIDKNIYSHVSALEENTHYKIDEYFKTVELTEEGYSFLEKDIPDLYHADSLELLTKINLVLKAEFLLKRDVHYIVRNDEILIVDEFTGRIMKDCKWPDGLQTAVELKEGLRIKASESVMNRITIQNFLNLYPNLCGMTGTALSSAPEFLEFYNKYVDVIPPNKPCIRIDHTDTVLRSKKAKYNAIINKIVQIHKTGQPMLIGTGSIRESEELKAMLQKDLPDICILNAKNDEKEASVIANSGKLNAVTISTNMAGRGVDIRLGGKDGAQYNQVVSLGGLYVIGTNRHNSVRIDNQLRGRSGRQGDPGESAFYISLEDDIFRKYPIDKMIPERIKPDSMDPLISKAIHKAIRHIQKVIEGQSLNAEISLFKYSILYEQQRKIVSGNREDILYDRKTIAKEMYCVLRESGKLRQISDTELNAALKSISLYAINECWADYLLLLENALDEVSVIGKSGSDPLLHYNHKLIEGFQRYQEDTQNKISEICKNMIIENDHIDLSKMGIQGPASTRTYMLLDGSEEIHLVNDLMAASLATPLYTIYLILTFFYKRKKRRE